MRIFGAVLLSSLVLVAGCANPPPQQQASCESASVPAGAVFGVREGMDIATYPPSAASGPSGCQRVWYGQRQRPEAMQVLATYHFENGHVRRLVGRVPGGPAYDCHYRDGGLEEARSQNPASCPKASELPRAN